MGALVEDRFGLGGVDQVSYGVAELQTSLPHYESLFGPFRVAELDAKRPVLDAAGYRRLFLERFDPTTAFAYLRAPEAMGVSVIELLEMP